MMKKLLLLVLALCLLTTAALAELDADGDCVIALPGVEVIFTPIDGAFLITPESSASEFRAAGLVQFELLPWMQENELYAISFDRQWDWELHVQIYPAQAGDYDDLTDVGLQRECNDLSLYYRESGYEVISCEPYRSPEGHVYVCVRTVYIYEDGTVEPCMLLMTVQHGYAACVYMFSYLEEMPPEAEALALELADSMWIKAVQ